MERVGVNRRLPAFILDGVFVVILMVIATVIYVAVGGTRMAWFGAESGWMETTVRSRDELDVERAGPCIIEEYDATCLVPPGCRARLDAHGNIRLAIAADTT